jgi:SAM-dependent methyltransferase
MTRYAAVFLIMMSNLLLELLLTRIFSATMWYHFAFMAVSIALFGTTVGAVIVQLWPHRFVTAHPWRRAGRCALLYAGSIVACTVLQLRLNVTFGASWDELLTVTALYVLIAVPFTLSGIFICLALLHAEDSLGAVYCADLLGAGVGCALFVPFMAYGGGPRAVLLLAAVAALGAALMASAADDRRTVVASLVCAALCLLAFGAHLDRRGLAVHWAKGNWDRDHAFEKWNAFSRLVVDPMGSVPFGWGLSTEYREYPLPSDQKLLTIDSAAATVLTAFDGDLSKLTYLQWAVTALPHAVRPGGSVLVIGVGGGRDILTALTFGHPRVVGVEVNSDILGLLDGPFADFTGHLGQRPDVELIHDEARSYVAGSSERFDVIQASLVDTWAAAANGAYVLSENALYTEEAFRIFLSHLEPGGVFSVSRWYFDAQPGESLRLVSLASAALRRQGIQQPQDRLFLVRGSHFDALSVATLLVGARPFTANEISTLRQWCAMRGFEILLGPGSQSSEIWRQLAGAQEPTAVIESFPLDLRAPTDDRPFFFNMLRLRDAFKVRRGQLDLIVANADAVVALAWLLVLVVTLSALFIVVPLWLGRAGGHPVPQAPLRLVYFVGLGLGFILIELSQMQRLMIALGHPVYGLTVVLFSLLVAAGAGSLWTGRRVRRGARGRWLQGMLLTLLLLAVATALGGVAVAKALEGAAVWMRIGASVLLLAPLGFLLGVPLAMGLALSASDPPGYRAMYWGVNGAASVCGSVLATIVSLSYGITVSYGVGVLAYAMCALVVPLAFSPGNAPLPTRATT